MNTQTQPERVSSGTPGLDAVLHGGLLSGHTAIVTGGPGTGKSILALQFLAAADGQGLYIGFEEREREIRRNAAALGIDLSNVSILDLSAKRSRFFADESYTLFSSEEVEGEGLHQQIASAIDDTDVDRLVIDPLSELRSLLPDDFQFRRNISSLFNELADRDITTICTAQTSDRSADSDLQYLGNTTIELHRSTERRSIEVTKFRGSDSATGRHTFRIHTGSGGHVYPKLTPGDHLRETDREQLPSEIDGLDALLRGGIQRGSVTIISGPSGVGKTTTGTHFLQAAAKRDEQAIAFLFEELRSDYLHRATQLGMDVERLAAEGSLEVEEVESLTQTPDEFAHRVREAVENRDAEFAMIDGTAGYRLGLRGDDSPEQVTRELHALCRYLKRMGVTVILIEEVRNVTGEFTATDQQISYLADNVVFLRYIEVDGEIEKAIGVLKKRFGGFEHSLRELRIDEGGLRVGDQLRGYRGLLTGTPESTGDSS
jgi:circadian clock protein KaiC